MDITGKGHYKKEIFRHQHPRLSFLCDMTMFVPRACPRHTQIIGNMCCMSPQNLLCIMIFNMKIIYSNRLIKSGCGMVRLFIIILLNYTFMSSLAMGGIRRDVSILNKAYVTNDLPVIAKYKSSSNNQLKYYSMSLLMAKNLNFRMAIRYVNRCLDEKYDVDDAYFMHAMCLFVKSSYYSGSYNMKYYYINYIKALDFMRKNSAHMDVFFGYRGATEDFLKKNPINKHMNPIKWADTIVSVNNKWETLPVSGGYVMANIDGKKLRLRVDTGSNGILLTRDDARSIGVLTKAMNTGATMINDGYDFESKSTLYVVPSINIGPIKISNAKVYVNNTPNMPYMRSSVGINLLRKLGSFVISKDGITRHPDNSHMQCNRMHVNNHGMLNAGWSISANVQTSFGYGSYLIDTGYDSDYGESLVIFRKYAESHNVKNNINVISSYRVSGSEFGGDRDHDVDIFRFGFNGHGNGYLGSIFTRKQNDSKSTVDGIIGFNTLRNSDMKIYLDFDRVMSCIFFDNKTVSVPFSQ